MYRQPSLITLKLKETEKHEHSQASSAVIERLFSTISKRNYRHLFIIDIRANDILGKCESHRI